MTSPPKTAPLKTTPPKTALVSLVLPLLTACQGPTAPASPAAPQPNAQPSSGQGVARKPVRDLLAQAQSELAQLEAIQMTQQDSAQALGALNGKLQSRGYFRRVPTSPATETLESNLRAIAVDKLLALDRVDLRMAPAPPPPEPVVVRPGQTWQPTLDDLRGIVHLSLDLRGRLEDAAAFIQALPSQCERLVVVTGTESLPGGVRLMAEAYYEHDLPPPRVEIVWPPLEERLRAGGWDPKDPALARNPDFGRLKAAVELGRERLPSVRHTLQITSDFPRWLLRAKFFEERATAAMATRGDLLLGTVPPSPSQPSTVQPVPAQPGPAQPNPAQPEPAR